MCRGAVYSTYTVRTVHCIQAHSLTTLQYIAERKNLAAPHREKLVHGVMPRREQRHFVQQRIRREHMYNKIVYTTTRLNLDTSN